MSHYYPDQWIVIEIIPDTNQYPDSVWHYRVLASWRGGYLHGESWKLNSGIVHVIEDDEEYHFHGQSGSIYHCRKGSYGTTGYTAGILNDMINRSHALIINTLPEDTNFMALEYK